MACVKKRRGKWVIDYRDTNGKRRWETVEGNREDAELRMSEIIGGGKKPVDRKAIFKQWAEHWLETEAKPRLKNSTYLEYKAVLENHLYPFFGSMRFFKVRREDVKRFIAIKVAAKKSRSTVKNMVAPLRAMYYDAIEDNVATSNPAVRLKKYWPSKEDGKKTRPKPLNREEIQHLLATVKAKMPHYYPLFLTAARTGLRLGELIVLKWESIDFHGRFIDVRYGWSRGEISSTKSKKAREVDMSQHLTDTLKSLLLRRKAEALKTGTGEIPELVFLTLGGTRLDENNFRKQVFHRALNLAGLRRVRFHDFRHSFGSLLIEQGEDLNYIKEQLGHHSITLTVDTYGHRLKDDHKGVDGLDEVENSDLSDHPGKVVAER